MATRTRAPPARAYSDDIDLSDRRRRLPGSARLVATLSPFQKLLQSHSRRRAVSDTSGEFNELRWTENSKGKSIRTFHGQARGILHGIFFVLLLRVLLALVAAVGTVGMVTVLVVVFKKESDVSLLSYVFS